MPERQRLARMLARAPGSTGRGILRHLQDLARFGLHPLQQAVLGTPEAPR